MLTPGKAGIVYHRGAGRGRAQALVPQVRKSLEAAGWQVVDIEPTRRADQARTELAPYLAGRCDLIVVVAGDGTLREICAGLEEAAIQRAIGFVPTGNANVVARDQGIPLDPAAAIRLLTTGTLRRLDVGRLRRNPDRDAGTLFLAMVEIGFGARVVALAHRLRDGKHGVLYHRWGDALYLAAALKALFSPEESPLRVWWNGAPAPLEAMAAIVANTRCYAKGWAVAPEARMDDGQLDLVARLKSGPGAIARAYCAAARARRPPLAISRCRRGRRFAFQSEARLAVQVDGDPMPPLKWMEIDVLPGRLSLIAPHGSS